MAIECRPDPKRCKSCHVCSRQGEYCCTTCPWRRYDIELRCYWCAQNGDTLYTRKQYEEGEL